MAFSHKILTLCQLYCGVLFFVVETWQVLYSESTDPVVNPVGVRFPLWHGILLFCSGLCGAFLRMDSSLTPAHNVAGGAPWPSRTPPPSMSSVLLTQVLLLLSVCTAPLVVAVNVAVVYVMAVRPDLPEAEAPTQTDDVSLFGDPRLYRKVILILNAVELATAVISIVFTFILLWRTSTWICDRVEVCWEEDPIREPVVLVESLPSEPSPRLTYASPHVAMLDSTSRNAIRPSARVDYETERRVSWDT